MARRAQITLQAEKATKPNTSKPEPKAEPTGAPDDKRRGQTLRLSVEAWKQLKRLAVDEERTSHDLLLEAVNRLFQDRGLPPVA